MLEEPYPGLESSFHTRVVPDDTPTIVHSFGKAPSSATELGRVDFGKVILSVPLAIFSPHLRTLRHRLLYDSRCDSVLVRDSRHLLSFLHLPWRGSKRSELLEVPSNVGIVLVGQ